jgi:hypothetical protein
VEGPAGIDPRRRTRRDHQLTNRLPGVGRLVLMGLSCTKVAAQSFCGTTVSDCSDDAPIVRDVDICR